MTEINKFYKNILGVDGGKKDLQNKSAQLESNDSAKIHIFSYALSNLPIDTPSIFNIEQPDMSFLDLSGKQGATDVEFNKQTLINNIYNRLVKMDLGVGDAELHKAISAAIDNMGMLPSSSVSFDDVQALLKQVCQGVNKQFAKKLPLKELFVDSDNSIHLLSDFVESGIDTNLVKIGFIKDSNKKGKKPIAIIEMVINGKSETLELDYALLAHNQGKKFSGYNASGKLLPNLKYMVEVLANNLSVLPTKVKQDIINEGISLSVRPMTAFENEEAMAHYNSRDNNCAVGIPSKNEYDKDITAYITHEIGHSVDQLNREYFATELRSNSSTYSKSVAKDSNLLQRVLLNLFERASKPDIEYYLNMYSSPEIAEEKIQKFVASHKNKTNFEVKAWTEILNIPKATDGSYDTLQVIEKMNKFAKGIGIDAENKSLDDLSKELIMLLSKEYTYENVFHNTSGFDNLDLKTWADILGCNSNDGINKIEIANSMLAILKSKDVDGIPKKLKSEKDVTLVFDLFKKQLQNMTTTKYIKEQFEKIGLTELEFIKLYVEDLQQNKNSNFVNILDADQIKLMFSKVLQQEENYPILDQILNNLISADNDKSFKLMNEIMALNDNKKEFYQLTYSSDKESIEQILDDQNIKFLDLFKLYTSLEGVDTKTAYCFASPQEFFAEYYAYSSNPDKYSEKNMQIEHKSFRYFVKMEELSKKNNKSQKEELQCKVFAKLLEKYQDIINGVESRRTH